MATFHFFDCPEFFKNSKIKFLDMDSSRYRLVYKEDSLKISGFEKESFKKNGFKVSRSGCASLAARSAKYL